MAIAARSTDFHAVATTNAPAKPGLWHRILDAVLDSRRRHVQQEIDRFVAHRGRRFTDSVERELNTRIVADGWNIR